MSEMKPTPGPWEVEIDEEGDWASQWPVITSPSGPVVGTEGFYGESVEQSLVDANLCAEAGTVFHETGLSPRQLVEMNAELVEALQLMVRTHDDPADGLLQEAREQRWLEQARAALTKASASSISKGVE